MRAFPGIIATAVVVMPGTAVAGGGAHVVDDATVETPGVCHLESWATRFGRRTGLINAAPACTRRAWPRLEIGGFIQAAWTDGEDTTTFGPALKYALTPEGARVRIGIAGAGALSDQGKLEGASLAMPVTIGVSSHITANLNGGYLRARAGDQHAAFWGAQIDAAVAPTLSIMGEIFGRDRGRAGMQAGLRWTPRRAGVDFDLLAGRYLDGTSNTAITFGVTLRR